MHFFDIRTSKSGANVYCLAYVGVCWPILRAMWAHLVAMLAYVWPMLSQKIRKMGTAKKRCKTQAILMVGGLSWGYVGPSWGYVGQSCGYVGPSSGLCGLVFALCRLRSWEGYGLRLDPPRNFNKDRLVDGCSCKCFSFSAWIGMTISNVLAWLGDGFKAAIQLFFDDRFQWIQVLFEA